ncbi:kinase-like domain-containing protein, partial [Dioszegia hungarica]
DEPLSPLHQSPTLSPSSSSSWKPPLPPSEDVELRLEASEAYLLGEGRYARVYLASYRGKGKGKEGVPECWTLCAAKRMNVDRESQTMGLREAFFLNRLQSPTRGVYIVKLLAVREQTERRSVHGRSASDLKTVLNRPRSSTEHLSSFPSLPSLHAARDTVSRSTLLLEHAEHGTLDMFLRTSPDLVGDETWIRWARQCSAAVAWTHEKGILHADIKPANLLLTATFDLRLSDFGSSLLIHSSHLPTDGVGLGTLPFSAPELVDPTQTFSFPVDIFALGATLYQCITGKEPYRGLRAMEMMHHVRRGGLWEYEDGQRYNFEVDSRESPYPSAWRDDPGVKRGGSLRLAPS